MITCIFRRAVSRKISDIQYLTIYNFKLITVMPNEHDYDEEVMSEGLFPMNIPFISLPTATTHRVHSQDTVLFDLDKLMEEERLK